MESPEKDRLQRGKPSAVKGWSLGAGEETVVAAERAWTVEAAPASASEANS